MIAQKRNTAAENGPESRHNKDAGLASELDIHFSPVNPVVNSNMSKKSRIKRKLSKIAFPFSSDDALDYNHDQSDEMDDTQDLGDSDSLNDKIVDPVDNNVETSDNNNNYVTDTPFSYDASTNNKSSHTLPRTSRFSYTHKQSDSNSSNSSTASLRLPSFTSNSRSNSSMNLPNPQSNLNGLNPLVPTKSITGIHSSPNKANTRYLATHNDHTFLLAKNNPQNPTLLQPPTSSNRQTHSSHSSTSTASSKHHHSASNSISHPSSSNNNVDEYSTAKVTPSSHLPQFNHVNQTSVLAPPTVLAPLAKTVSSQSTSQHSYKNSNLPSNLNPNSTSSDMDPNSYSSSTLSLTSRNKKSAGLLQAACRISHQQQFHHNHHNNNDNTNNTSKTSSTKNSSDDSYPNLPSSSKNFSSEDYGSPLISCKIIDEFQNLQRSVQLGIRKRIEYIENESSMIVSNIEKQYKEIEKMEKMMMKQIEELDDHIKNLKIKKETDFKNLRKEGLFENFNDLTARIDTVKSVMHSNDVVLKDFEAKLDTIEKLKISNESRSKSMKQMMSLSTIVVLGSIIVKYWLF